MCELVAKSAVPFEETSELLLNEVVARTIQTPQGIWLHQTRDGKYAVQCRHREGEEWSGWETLPAVGEDEAVHVPDGSQLKLTNLKKEKEDGQEDL